MKLQLATDNQNPSTLRRTAAWTLGTVMVGHVLLETGVDATFLANVSVDRLPVVTIAIAFIALSVARFGGDLPHRTVLIAIQGVAAIGTVFLCSLAMSSFMWSYYALYIWSGVIGSLVIVRFWLLLGDLFTIGEGKKAFATIAMGGSIGALVGSGIGAALAPRIGGEGMLMASAFFYGSSVLGSIRLPIVQVETETPMIDGDRTGLAASFRALIDSPYASRVALLVVISGATLTLGDFLFKSVLTEKVASEDLAVWLSRIYLGLNLLSILVLAAGVTPIVRRLGVDRSLVVLPALVGGAVLGVFAGAALAATIIIKAVDGTLRYSLHKTATELLYLPMTSGMRASVKAAIDIVGQTGAKAIASILILGLLFTPDPQIAVSTAILVASAVWIAMALRLRRPYLDMFRNTLGEGSIETMVDYPELDLESVGSWVQALSDPDKDRSIAAMRLLAERGQEQLIPNLIVYHPAPEVVAHALDLFARTQRRNLGHLLDRLVTHEFAEVRAASVRAKWAIERDFEGLQELAHATCPVVRVSALAGLLAEGEVDRSALADTLSLVTTDEWCSSRMAAATAARLHYDPLYRESLSALVTDPDLGVAREAIRAIRESEDPWFIEGLVSHLGVRHVRPEIRVALLGFGKDALAVLEARLVDPDVPAAIRLHIPRTVAHFERDVAAAVLLASLPRVGSGMIRFKILRGLEAVVRGSKFAPFGSNPRMGKAEVAVIQDEFDLVLASTCKRFETEVGLGQAQRRDSTLTTTGGELLVDLLRDKRSLAVGRLFMMLGLIFPGEDFRAIESGLRADDKRDRASAAELLETLLPTDVASELIKLATPKVLDASAPIGSSERTAGEYADLVNETIIDGSESLRAVALYHAAEVDLEPRAMTGEDDSSARASDSARAQIDRGTAAIQDLFDRHAGVRTSTAR
jgi:AAA family ATP:ADP antiporter